MSQLRGRKTHVIIGASAADTAKTISSPAPAVGNSMRVVAYFAVATAAAVGAVDPQVAIEDSANLELWVDNFGALAVRVTRIGMVFGFDAGIPVTSGLAAELVAEAGGTGVIFQMGMIVEEYT